MERSRNVFIMGGSKPENQHVNQYPSADLAGFVKLLVCPKVEGAVETRRYCGGPASLWLAERLCLDDASSYRVHSKNKA